MSGKKGRSGRKSNAYYVALTDFNGTELPVLLSKCGYWVNKFFEDPDQTLKDKADLASRFLLKAMPQRVEGELDSRSFREITIKLEGIEQEGLLTLSQACRQRALSEEPA